MLGIKPGAVGLEASMLPLCYAVKIKFCQICVNRNRYRRENVKTTGDHTWVAHNNILKFFLTIKFSSQSCLVALVNLYEGVVSLFNCMVDFILNKIQFFTTTLVKMVRLG